MAQIHNNPLLKSATGILGKTVVFRQWRGKLVLASRPARRKFDSEKQQLYISKFREATQYAKSQMTDAASKAEYQSAVNDRKHNAYTVALADFLNPPKIHYIKANDYKCTIGDTITIKATDDFKVVSVKVMILASGAILEQGDATQYFKNHSIWKYHTSVTNANSKGTMIKVMAFDKPGNCSTREIVV